MNASTHDREQRPGLKLFTVRKFGFWLPVAEAGTPLSVAEAGYIAISEYHVGEKYPVVCVNPQAFMIEMIKYCVYDKYDNN